MQWQPIETAPKGKTVLGYSPGDKDFGGYPVIVEIEWFEGAKPANLNNVQKSYWTWSPMLGYDMMGDEYKFTHWIDLPEKPR